MNGQIIYFDHNAALDVMSSRDPALTEAVEKARSLGAKFVYSPAHMEEVANILRSPKLTSEQCWAHVQEHLQFFSGFTDNWEFLPGQRNPVILKQESPEVCFGRVIVDYDLTLFAEDEADKERENIEEQRTKEPPLDVFELPEIAERIDNLLFYNHFDEPVRGHDLRLAHSPAVWMIHLCFQCLSEFGYGLESKNKTRSAIHDVTHSIYGLNADVFVSKDRRLLGKAKATYQFLSAPSTVLSTEEFVAHVRSNS